MLARLVKLHLDILNRGRKIKDQALKPLVDCLPARVNPSHLTSLRVVILILALAAYLQNLIGNPAFVILLALAALTDGLDGALARAKNSGTNFGVTYDLLADRLMFMAVFFFFYKLTADYGWIGQSLIDLLTAAILLVAYFLKKDGLIRPLLTLRWLVFFLWLLFYLISPGLK